MLKNQLKQKVAKFILLFAMLLGSWTNMSAFDGSDLANGQKFYLFNIYQSKFLGAENKLQAPNIGAPVAFTAGNGGFTIGGTTYAATRNGEGFYQLKNGNEFFAFEDKVADPDSPEDENRAMYLGGGVTCKNTTNNTDRSYWQLISEEEYAAWQAKKKFTVSSLNVDGMPASVKVYNIYTVNLNPDATGAAGATAIGNRLRESGFDVVGVSEDFDFHNQLWDAAWNNGQGIHYNAGTHRGKLQDAANAAGVLSKYLGKNPIIDSDGLCFFYRMGVVDQNTVESTESWTQWNDHYGYDDHGADGLIKKGYRFYVVKLADGTEVDVYTMHMDAESSAEDNAARAKQLTQIANAIKATNNKRPIIIIGDSNCRYTRDKVKSNLIDAINADPRFTIRDPWIQYGRNGVYPTYPSGSIMASTNGYLSGEVVDKIWYINNKDCGIRIVAETYCQDLSFVDDEGSPLCDHKPCVVTFSYHPYDSTIDDQYKPEDEKEDDSAVYLRNRGTGRFLKSGGAWGTHSIVGNYPIGFNMEKNNGKYALHCEAGYVSCEADNTQTFVDTNNGNSVNDWELINQDGFYVFAHNGRALSANDPYYFNDDPNYRWVILDALNPTDKLQQWEVLTKDQMMEELLKANAKNPVNASWLMSNPNFDRNFTTAKWNNNISASAGRMTSNLAGGKNDGSAEDNFVGEAYVANKNSNGTTLWDINQVLSNVPNGWYRVSAQAFQRISNSNTTTATIQLYANDKAQQVELMYNLKAETTNAIGSKKDGNYYYPDNMSEASQYFLKGYYQNSVWVNVTDGTLKVGIRKTSDTGKSNNAWCCFDNFQLYYFGNEKPSDAEKLGVNIINDTRKAKVEGEKVTLTGTWREVDMKDITDANAPATGDLKSVIDSNNALVVDATKATLVCRPKVQSENPNVLILADNAADVANTDNVIVGGKCANLVLCDEHNLSESTLEGVLTESMTVNRSFWPKEWNTFCVPFDITVENLTKDGKITNVKKLASVETTDEKYQLHFGDVDENNDRKPYLKAGESYIVWVEATGDGKPFTKAISSTNEAEFVLPSSEDIDNITFQGVYNKGIVPEHSYIISGNQFWHVSNSYEVPIKGFRAYFEMPTDVIPEGALSASFDDDELTGITSVTNGSCNGNDYYYNVAGQRVNANMKGIIIKNGKKYINK